MNPIATQLNEQIKTNAPPVFDSLSDLGKNLFFPKGIVSQSEEAKLKARRFNATAGIAMSNGKPMIFNNLEKYYPNYSTSDVFPYVSVHGRKKLRELWLDKLIRQNPKLKNAQVSLPFPTCGITHGISIAANMFVEAGDTVLLPDKLWGNYRLIFGTYRRATIQYYRFFDENNALDTASLKNALLEHGKKTSGKLIVMFNFPNNPTGYTCTEKEAYELQTALIECATSGVKVICLCDESYFGLFYENCLKESFFSLIASQHENLIAVKLDGATKELFVWGLRVGFLTFGIQSPHSKPVYDALEKKVAGLVRGTVSSLNHHSQSVIETELSTPESELNRRRNFDELNARAFKIKELHRGGRYDAYWEMYPFNSGYFMCVKLKKNLNAERLRLHLLDKYQTGVVSTSDTDIRIAFSCLNLPDIEPCFDIIADGCRDLTHP